MRIERLDVDRLAVPENKPGGGKSTSNIVILLSDLDFKENPQRVAFVTGTWQKQKFIMDLFIDICHYRGNKVKQINSDTLLVDDLHEIRFMPQLHSRGINYDITNHYEAKEYNLEKVKGIFNVY